MERQKALRFHDQKDLHLWTEDEQKSYKFGTDMRVSINYIIFG